MLVAFSRWLLLVLLLLVVFCVFWLLALLFVRWCFGGFMANFGSDLMLVVFGFLHLVLFEAVFVADSPRWFFRSDLAAARWLLSELGSVLLPCASSCKAVPLGFVLCMLCAF
ncbi:hypothetical protein U1Q18_026299 [Sarracenia purpurea var. burkii]